MSLGQDEDEKKKVNYPKGPGEEWLVFSGKPTPPDSPQPQPHVYFLAGDEESRSEEALPIFAKALSDQYGWKCTVLFSQSPETGDVDPNEPSHMPNLAGVNEADLVVLSLRYREFDDDAMKNLVEHFKKGKPVLGLRHSLAAFGYDQKPNRKFAYLDWQSEVEGWRGGFGEHVLGSRWIDNWSRPGQGTRILAEAGEIARQHPILQGFQDLQLTSGVTQVTLPTEKAVVLLRGQVLASQEAGAPPVDSLRKSQKMNNPMMPVAWTYEYQVPKGKLGRAFATTMGSAEDFSNAAFTKIVANAACWLLKQSTGTLGTWPRNWKASDSGVMKFRPKTKPKAMLRE